MVKREAVKSIENQKHQMIASLHANSVFDESEKGLEERKKRIENIEKHFNTAIELVYDPSLHQEQEIDWNNPFWAAARRSLDRRMERIRGEKSVAQVVPEMAEHRKREYDQL